MGYIYQRVEGFCHLPTPIRVWRDFVHHQYTLTFSPSGPFYHPPHYDSDKRQPYPLLAYATKRNAHIKQQILKKWQNIQIRNNFNPFLDSEKKPYPEFAHPLTPVVNGCSLNMPNFLYSLITTFVQVDTLFNAPVHEGLFYYTPQEPFFYPLSHPPDQRMDGIFHTSH